MRTQDWVERYAAELQAAQSKRFRWDRWNCCHFAARMVRAITGADPREKFPTYQTRTEAEAIIAAAGGMRELVNRALGDPVHPSRACRGDIVLADFGRGPQPSVCVGERCVAPGRRGLEQRPMSAALDAWNI